MALFIMSCICIVLLQLIVLSANHEDLTITEIFTCRDTKEALLDTNIMVTSLYIDDDCIDTLNREKNVSKLSLLKNTTL